MSIPDPRVGILGYGVGGRASMPRWWRRPRCRRAAGHAGQARVAYPDAEVPDADADGFQNRRFDSDFLTVAKVLGSGRCPRSTRNWTSVRSQLRASALAGTLNPRFRVLGDQATFTKYGLDVQEPQIQSERVPTEPRQLAAVLRRGAGRAARPRRVPGGPGERGRDARGHRGRAHRGRRTPRGDARRPTPAGPGRERKRSF